MGPITRSVLLILALLLQACSSLSTADAIATGVAQTEQISQLETAAAAAATPQGLGGSAEQATATPQPGASIPYVSVSVDTHCRRGPSINYDHVTTITSGQQVEVLKAFDSNYVLVRNPNGSGDCWLWLRYADNTDFSEHSLPLATQPPTPTPTLTPTPTYDWSGTWSLKLSRAGMVYTETVTFSVSASTVNGIATWSGFNFPLTGMLSANKHEVSGTWTVGVTYPWGAMIKADNPNQFIGNLHNQDGIWAFCGWRGGAGEPSPCMWP